jgi:hypothetical protein
MRSAEKSCFVCIFLQEPGLAAVSSGGLAADVHGGYCQSI